MGEMFTSAGSSARDPSDVMGMDAKQQAALVQARAGHLARLLFDAIGGEQDAQNFVSAVKDDLTMVTIDGDFDLVAIARNLLPKVRA
jgi:hypothetical protein